MPALSADLLQLIAILAVCGIVAGFLAGLLGIGGGIVMTPTFFLVFTWEEAAEPWRMHMALATSLAVIVPTTLSSARAHWRRGSVDGRIARHWSAMAALGAACGAAIAAVVSTDILIILFSAFAAIMGIKMLLPFEEPSIGRALPVRGAGRLAPAGIGTLAALMGIGGATFTVPYLTLFGVPVHRAVGTAALIGAIIALVGVAGYVAGGWGRDLDMRYTLGFVHLPALAITAPLAVMVAPIGAAAAHRLPHRFLSILFGSFLLLTAIRLTADLV